MLTPAQLKQIKLEQREDGYYSAQEVDRLLGQIGADYSEVFTENGNFGEKAQYSCREAR